MSIKPRSFPTKTLAQNLAAGGTTLYVNNWRDWDWTTANGNVLSSADLGTQWFATIRNAQNSQVEFIELDPATINTTLNTVTILKRALGYGGSQTASTETGYDWLAGALIEFGADTPQLMLELVEEAGDETIDGKKTFSTVPATTGGNAVADNDLVRLAQLNSTALGTTNINRVIIAGTAGETIAVDQLIYLKVSDGRWWLCDADTAATVDNVILGIAQGVGTAGNAIAGGVLTQGLNTFSALTLTANTKYYASNTAGGFSSSAGTTEVTLGMSQTTTTFLFYPRFDQVLTENQQDALIGNNADVVVGAANTLVTQTGLQHNVEKYVLDTSGSSTAYIAVLSPLATSLTTGMVVHAKLVNANTTATPTLTLTGTATAKTIVKYLSTPLVVGDILANMICTFIYDGTNFVLQNPASVQGITCGQGLRLAATGTGTQAFAHGLASTPRMIRFWFSANNGNNQSFCTGTGSATSTSVYSCTVNCASNDTNTSTQNTKQFSNAVMETLADDGTTALSIVTVSALDSTNVTLNFTTHSLSLYWQWEAFS